MSDTRFNKTSGVARGDVNWTRDSDHQVLASATARAPHEQLPLVLISDIVSWGQDDG